MPAWLLPVLALEGAIWAALFAVLAGHRLGRDDVEGMMGCVRMSACSLLAGLGFLIWSKGA